MVLISFILNTNSNNETFEKSLNSFFNQKFQDFELVTITNYTNKEITSLIKKYQNKISSLKFKNNPQEILKKINGKYICFFNTTYILSNSNVTQQLHDTIKENTTNIISTNIQIETQPNITNQITYNYQPKQQLITQKQNTTNITSNVVLSNKFFNKEIFQKNKYNLEMPFNNQENIILYEILTNNQEILTTPINFATKISNTKNTKQYIKLLKNYHKILKLNQENKINTTYLEHLSKNLTKINTELPQFTPDDYQIIEKEIQQINQKLTKKDYTITYQTKKTLRYFKELTHNQITKFPTQISIIIPTYNVEEYIDDCINSLTSQTYKNFEAIFVDDLSQDSTTKIIQEYAQKDKRIKLIKKDYNSGSGGSRNLGMKHANGKYILFLDGDDWLDKNTLENLHKYAEHYETQIVMFKGLNYDENTKTFYKDEYFDMPSLKKYNNKTFNFNQIHGELFKIFVGPINKLYLKSFLEDLNASFPEKYIHQDNPFFYQTFCEAEKIYLTNQYFYNRRMRKGSITTLRDDTELGTIEIVEYILKVFINNKLYDKFKSLLLNRLLFKLRNRNNLVGEEYKQYYYLRTKTKLEKFMFEYKLYDDFFEVLEGQNRKYFESIIYSETFNEFRKIYYKKL